MVIATNIAEASLTIDGIFYVVDPGEPTLPYPTVPEPTFPYPTVPEPAL